MKRKRQQTYSKSLKRRFPKSLNILREQFRDRDRDTYVGRVKTSDVNPNR